MTDVNETIQVIQKLSAKEQFDAIVSIHSQAPDDSLFPVRVGIGMRDRGDFDLADKVLSIYAHHTDTQRHSAYELAISKSLQGDPDAAISSIKLIDKKRWGWKHLKLMAVQYARLGDSARETDCLNALSPSGVFNEELLTLRDQCLYLRSFSLSKISSIIDSVYHKIGESSPKIVATSIIESIEKGLPYSLIRFGDGEGSWLSVDPGDEITFRNLYRTNRKEFVRNWFDNESLVDNIKFISHVSKLNDALVNSNHAGLPSRSWIEHEYTIASQRGVSSLANIIRKLNSPSFTGKSFPTRCNQMIHVDLLRSDFLDHILRNRKQVIIISCHKELQNLLAEKYNIMNVEMLKVPGSQQFKSILGEEAAEGVHYPDRFIEICLQLEKSASGKIVLVGAGPLGKIYCDIAKKSGGVAIDIGSIADVWMKKITRPFSDDIYKLGLLPT